MENLTLLHSYAEYNHWMNEKLYAVCADIPDEVRKQPRGAFFGSIHGTLNHLLLGDRLWLCRFQGESDAHLPALNAELYADFAELRHERWQTDAALSAWLSTVKAADLSKPVTFIARVTQQQHRFRLGHVVLHLFNHQTHHRGQLTTLLSQLGYDYGVTDMLWLPGNELC